VHDEELHNSIESFTKDYNSNENTENVIGRACSIDGKMRIVYHILLENLKGRDRLEDLGVDGR